MHRLSFYTIYASSVFPYAYKNDIPNWQLIWYDPSRYLPNADAVCVFRQTHVKYPHAAVRGAGNDKGIVLVFLPRT